MNTTDAEFDSPAYPTKLQRGEAGEIVIQWSDERRTVHTARSLRAACPCASCREKHKSEEETPADAPPLLPVLSAAEARPLEITAMRPAGQYAYNIQFSDGHTSGLFTFDLLRSMKDVR